MKIALVYKSSTGFTEHYAEYIAEKTGAELVKYSERKRVESSDYDILVFGSSIIAAGISGVAWFDKVKNEFKHSFLFVTGANPKEDNPDLEKYIEAEKIKGHDIFYMPGGLNYEKMSAPMRFIMKKMFLPMVKKEQGEDSIMYKMVSSSYSLYDEKYAQPLLDEIRRVFARNGGCANPSMDFFSVDNRRLN